MRKFRFILTLLLCLTVPAAGWASVLGGPLCPQLHQHGVAGAADQDHLFAHRLASACSDTGQQPQHCDGTASHGKPCKGDHCACGCGVGACSSPALSLLLPMPASFAALGGNHAVVYSDTPPYVAARGTSPLRPPIS